LSQNSRGQRGSYQISRRIFVGITVYSLRKGQYIYIYNPLYFLLYIYITWFRIFVQRISAGRNQFTIFSSNSINIKMSQMKKKRKFWSRKSQHQQQRQQLWQQQQVDHQLSSKIKLKTCYFETNLLSFFVFVGSDQLPV